MRNRNHLKTDPSPLIYSWVKTPAKCSAILFIIFYCISCKTSGILKSATDPQLVRNIDFIYPISDISYIETDNKTKYNDSLTAIANELMFKTLFTNKETLSLADYYPISDTNTYRKLKTEIKEIAEIIVEYKNITHIEYTPTLDSMFSSKGNRFLMVTYGFGFVRSQANYTSQVIDDLLLSSMSGGQIIKYSSKTVSTLLVIIFDTINKKITFARYNTELTSPLQRDTYRKHLLKILNGYLISSS